MSNRSGRDRDDDDDAPRRGASGFRYQRRDPEEAQKRTERNTSGMDSYLSDACKIYKAPEGDNLVRIIPATWDGAKHYGSEVFLHYDVGADGAAYFCNEKMKGKACPICEERLRAKSAGDDEYADKLRPNARVLIYLVNREKPRDGVQVWSIGARMDNDIARLAIDKKSGEYLEIDHPEKGYDLSFVRDGQGMKTRYTGFQIARRSTALDDDKALQFAVENPLPDQFIYYPYDHIKKVFGGGGGAGAERDEDPKPRSRASSRDDDDPKPRARAAADDEDPKPRARAASKPKVDLTWEEIHELSFRKLANLIDENKLDIEADASRNDDELADQICAALDIDKPKPRRARDDDEPAPRTRARTDDEDPPRRARAADDDPPPRTRARTEEDTPARQRLRKLADDDIPY